MAAVEATVRRRKTCICRCPLSIFFLHQIMSWGSTTISIYLVQKRYRWYSRVAHWRSLSGLNWPPIVGICHKLDAVIVGVDANLDLSSPELEAGFTGTERVR